MNKGIRNTLRIGLAAVALVLSVLAATLPPVQGQGTTYRAEAVVLVNSNSTGYTDFAYSIQPYLDHFGVPYTILDIAAAPVPSSLAEYALIIIGHRNLDPARLYLDGTEQSRISTAVFNGTGLVNFDNVLAESGTPIYSFVQNIFRFNYTAAVPHNRVEIQTNVPAPWNYVVAAQPANAIYQMGQSISPTGVVPPADAAVLASLNGQPLLVAVSYGQGRAIQWTSYAWLNWRTWGYLSGFDDLVWRGIVSAARKPFVFQGMPPLVTFRNDDSTGGYNWVLTANRYGFKPWLGIFLPHGQ